MPFAGLIMKDPTMTPGEFATQNFTQCSQTALTNMSVKVLQPFYYASSVVTAEFSEFANALNSIRSMFDKVRLTIKSYSEDVMNRVLNITLPLSQFVINMKDMMGKMVGTLTASLFTLLGSYLTIQSFMMFLVDLLLYILVGLSGVISAFLAISFFVPPAAGLAAINMVIMIAILIPTILIKILMDDVMHLQTASTPPVPGCFAQTTSIPLFEFADQGRLEKNIADILVGDRLYDGGKVTAIIKFAAHTQQIYNLNGVFVTGEHRIYCKDSGGWVKVKNHPQSIFVPYFSEPYVYCLNTTTKTFQIGGEVYSDWDDIDAQVLAALRQNCVSKGYLPANFLPADIHTYLESGLHGNSLIITAAGDKVFLKNIAVNVCLSGGERVLGVFKMAARDINGVYSYRFKNGLNIISSRNIHIEDPSLGTINMYEMQGEEEIREVDYLYHLITNTGFFYR
jgi:hypothetical protein